MLDRFPPYPHGLRVLVAPALDGFQNALVFPSGDASLNACRTTMLDGAGTARVGPVASQGQAVFLVREVVFKTFARWADLDIFIGQITEVGFNKAAFGSIA